MMAGEDNTSERQVHLAGEDNTSERQGRLVGEDNTSEGQVRLKRKIGLPTSLSLVIGSIIGSGIFITPGGIAAEVGSVGATLLIWIVCGAISLLLSFAYAELGTLVKHGQGGDYAYILEGFKGFDKFFGPLPAFLFLWMKLITGPATVAIAALAFAQYVTRPFFPSCETPLDVLRTVAALCILSASLINLLSVTLVSRMLVLFTVMKLATLAMIIIGGIVRIIQGNSYYLKTGFEGSSSSPGSYAVACYIGLYAYEGWDNVCTIVEEMINPKRNVPLSMLTGLGIVIAVYVLATCSFFTVMSPIAMTQSDAVAITWAENVIGAFSLAMPILVACSVMGMLIALVLSDSRIFFAGAREGQLMGVIAMVHITKGIPAPSLILQATLGVVYICLSDIYSLMRFRIFCEILFRTITISSLFILRRTIKYDRKAVFKTPTVILVIGIMLCVFLMVAPIVDNPRIEILYAFLVVLSGVVFYVPFVYYKLRLPYIDKLTSFIQILLLVAPTTD